MLCELLKKILETVLQESKETNVIMAAYLEIECGSPLLLHGRV